MQTRHALSAMVVLSVAAAAHAQVLFYDFGHTDRQSDPSRFNNLVPGVQSIADSIDENGNPTGFGIEITNPFFLGEPSQGGSENPTGLAAQFGADATDDYFFGHTTPFAGAEANPLSIVEFQNLDLTLTYSFTIFASRTGITDNREAVYEAFGTEIVSGVLNASNNESDVLVLSGLTPGLDGTISISVLPSVNNDNMNGFYYLGAIRLDAVPAPGTAAVFGVVALASIRRRR